MKVLLTIYGNDELWSSLSKDEFDRLIAEDAAFREEVRESGELVGVEGLQDAAYARTVKVRDGVPVVSEGPHLESKEYPASFFVLDCESLDRALELAAKCPAAKANGVEVWPLMDQNGFEE
ncbi:MAG TPA: YciI family protein [Kribbella sp.]|nr:YciI family protein [Kribbella sp.]